MAKRPRFSDHSPRVSKRDYDKFNIDGGKRSVRKRYSAHNAIVWPLPPDLTIKVFSMLDTLSVCSAAATCLFFQKCAVDPFCYTNIDLATSVPDMKVPKINDAMVSTMIQRAGSALESIKLGVLLSDWALSSRVSSLLTSSCLSSLSANGGASGSHLRILHLYGINEMDDIELSTTLSVCPSLVDLEIVDLNVEVSPTLESVSRFCYLLERFIYRSEGNDDILETSACKKFVLNCPKITTLAVKGCDVSDHVAFKMVKGFHELKYVDFSYCNDLTGFFLKNLATKGGANNLEVMILEECLYLDKGEVKAFMKALLAGKFRLLRHLDISNSDGLAVNGDRCYSGSFIPERKLFKQRPNFCLISGPHKSYDDSSYSDSFSEDTEDSSD